MMIRVTPYLICILLIVFIFYKKRHKHEHKKVLYYIDDLDKIELYSEYRCSCGNRKNHRYITTKYFSTVSSKNDICKKLKTLGYVPKEELEADLIAPLDWVKGE